MLAGMLCCSVGRIGMAQELVRAAPRLQRPCDDLDTGALADAIEREIPALQKLPPAPGFRFGRRTVAPAEYAEHTLARLARLARQGNKVLCQELPRSFLFFRDRAAALGKFTGYHHPVYRGSRQRTEAYRYPLYRRPPDAEHAALPTADIVKGGLAGRGLELVYLADPTAALDAHIEGSATIEFDDGTAVNLTTDGHNGWPYQNVSRMVLQDGRLSAAPEQVTPPGMTRVRRYFLDHPEELWAYWSRNPHYVFFRETEARGTGKFGELVPGRSVAVDPRRVPMGAALWIRSERPKGTGAALREFVRYGRVALAQDTGAAILGPGRVDLFFGSGEYAQQAAQVVNRPGEVYVLLARPPKRAAGRRKD